MKKKKIIGATDNKVIGAHSFNEYGQFERIDQKVLQPSVSAQDIFRKEYGTLVY